jgi:tRNA pseudouridine38-40 synthase
MTRYLMIIAYDGTFFSGWQRQKNDTTVQGEIEKALATLLRTQTPIFGCSRTDASVHALCQTAHFDSEKKLTTRPFLRSMQALLPHSIIIKDLIEVDSSFHARFSAKRKTYQYLIRTLPYPDPFAGGYMLPWRGDLDCKSLQKEAHLFIGTHDFSAFANDQDQGAAKNKPVKTIDQFEVIKTPFGAVIKVRADGFLYKMVRNMVGLLLASQKGKFYEIPYLLRKKERKLLPAPAPAMGLFLSHIEYANEEVPGLDDQKMVHDTLFYLAPHLKEDNVLSRSTQV